MTLLVQFELTPKKPNENELTAFLAQIMLDTINYPGCHSAKFFTALDESADVILLEDWDKRTSFNEYLTWRTKRGDFDKLLELLNGPPKLRYLSDNYTLITEVRKACGTWMKSFNAGDASACSAMYEDDAILNCKPIGQFKGT